MLTNLKPYDGAVTLSIELSNLGPLRSAELDLADLTLLIGDNNTGKTFFATVLHHTLNARHSARSYRFSSHLPTPDQLQDLICDLLDHHFSKTSSEDQWEPEPNESTLKWLTEVTTRTLRAYGAEVRALIEDAYGTEASDLRRRTRSRHAVDCYLWIRNSSPAWQINIRFDSDAIHVRPPEPRAMLQAILKPQKPSQRSSRILRERLLRLLEDLESRPHSGLMYREIEAALHPRLPRRAIYLPAGRTGIMHSYHVLASNVVRQSVAAGIRPIEVEPLPGAAAEFISLVLSPQDRRLRGRPHREMKSIIDDVERDLRAEIVMDRKSGMRHAIVAMTPEGPFPLWRTSSMISELAPVVLVLKYSISRGDHLTIDEPEAHLHPAMQRRIANSLVRLVRHGIRATITTHSDYFVSQLNNMIRTNELAGSAEATRYSGLQRMDRSRLRVLRFSRTNRWCVARSSEIHAVDGIDGSTFTDVMESQYDESAALVNELLEEPFTTSE